ncbi:ABC transporter permease [Kordiimonas sp. SCSIO 12610]|uniref:ABC transporter permease n=1 Tax=Kordiimonas sp. SCSIO 12610 TaxID=2829597 RepID=UPI002109F54F|nr:ABC transporter permease subunit [Kordiimonas sp. SCSIO 12610]UTW56734.1 ABC transporter permease [Kordiimonas sp. SCSIO 12610]
MMTQFKIVFLKELKDAIRDKRAIMAVLSYALLVPLFLGFVGWLATLDQPVESVKTQLAIANIDSAPGLVAFVEKNGINVIGADNIDPNNVAIPESAEALLVIPLDFQDNLAKAKISKLALYVDNTTRERAERGTEVEAVLTQYSQYVGLNRLIARGIPPNLVSPYRVSKADVSESKFYEKLLISGLSMMLIIAPIVGGMSVSLDTLAGERERQSLQTLLTQPVSSNALIFGKWAVVSLFSFVTVMLMSFALIIMYVTLVADKLPFSLGIGLPGFLIAFFQLGIFSMFVASLLMTVSIHAKSFKEGQTYMQLLNFVPVMLAYVKIYADSSLPDAARFAPFIADIESLSTLLVDGSVQAAYFATSLGVAFVGTILCIMFTSKRLSSEKLLDEV